jgi:hexosaminidase
MPTRLATLLLGLTMATCALDARAQFAIIPQPQQIAAGTGSFVLDNRTTIAAPADKRAQEIADFLRDAIREQTGIALAADHAVTHHAHIELRIDLAIYGDEAYRLTVTPALVTIAASSDRGLFWGMQTLRQLLPQQRAASLNIPAVRIDDAPRYVYRGVMLDVARHFMPVAFVEKQIDLLSHYKINTFHWHLTDDQGWRIEIRKYPKLTEVGAWRTEADGRRTGGFYTQQQIRDVVEYARQRNIMVIPEIEMPGHSSAAIAAYPQLSCPKKPIEVPAGWGVFSDIYCAGDEATFTFLQNVLDEVTALFPAPYIHIGGDEVPKTQWLASATSQQRMRDERLKDGDGLQSYFIQRIQRYLADKGKTLTGWDEILEGGADKSAVIEMWRGDDEARKALANGNRLIVAGPYYLDSPIDGLTVADVYRTDAFADPMYAAHRDQILGAEAPLWSERVTPLNAAAMLYPRTLAFAERLWNPDAHDVADFLRRLHTQDRWMDAQHIAYGPEDKNLVDYRLSFNADHRRWRLRAARGFDDLRLHYTIDSSEPTAQSLVFDDVLDLYAPATLKVAPFRGNIQYLSSETFTLADNKALGKPVSYQNPPAPKYAGAATQLVDGILGGADFHDGQWVGWSGTDMAATIDLQQPTTLQSIDVHFLQQSGSWILLPRSVSFAVSDDGKTWKQLQTTPIDVDAYDMRAIIHDVRFDAGHPLTTRYVRVVAQQYGELPADHDGAGHPAYVFADEIVVR